ncbi:MAG: poly-beta-1,6-N-acetyl-D-glucosamine biosynthesis protein PgaD, partial [Thiohalomonadales bacterium]
VPKTKRLFEVMLMAVSWSLWVYLITPLISLLVWYAGGILFVERMLTPGSLDILGNVAQYGVAIFTMWLVLAIWIIWNKVRYSDKRDRRTNKAPVIDGQKLAEHSGLSLHELDYMKESREMFLKYDEDDRPVLVEAEQNALPVKSA